MAGEGVEDVHVLDGQLHSRFRDFQRLGCEHVSASIG